jgi:hypothetical protein
MLPAPLSAVRNLWRLATEVTLVENMVLPLKSIKLALKLARSAAPTLPRASSPSSSAARGDDDRRVDVGVAAPPASITVVVQAAGLIMLRCFFFAAVTLSLASLGPLASLILMRINVKAPLNDTSGAIDGACFHTGGGGGQQLARSRELELRAQVGSSTVSLSTCPAPSPPPPPSLPPVLLGVLGRCRRGSAVGPPLLQSVHGVPPSLTARAAGSRLLGRIWLCPTPTSRVHPRYE